MYYIGVDLGTSAVKLLLMEESGKICNIVSKEYPLFFPHPGWSEQNPEDWWEQSKEGIIFWNIPTSGLKSTIQMHISNCRSAG